MVQLAPERVRGEQRLENEDLDTGVSGGRTASSEALRGAGATSRGLESARRLRLEPGEQRGEQRRWVRRRVRRWVRRRADHGWCPRHRALSLAGATARR